MQTLGFELIKLLSSASYERFKQVGDTVWLIQIVSSAGTVSTSPDLLESYCYCCLCDLRMYQ